MDAETKALIRHCISYAVLQRASDVITEKQLQGIKRTLETVEPHVAVSACNFVLHALNENYELKLKKWIESNSIIVRP